MYCTYNIDIQRNYSMCFTCNYQYCTVQRRYRYHDYNNNLRNRSVCTQDNNSHNAPYTQQYSSTNTMRVYLIATYVYIQLQIYIQRTRAYNCTYYCILYSTVCTVLYSMYTCNCTYTVQYCIMYTILRIVAIYINASYTCTVLYIALIYYVELEINYIVL